MIRRRLPRGRVQPIRFQLRARRILLASMKPWLAATLEHLEAPYRAAVPVPNVRTDAPTTQPLRQALGTLRAKLTQGLSGLHEQLRGIGDDVQRWQGGLIRDAVGEHPATRTARLLRIDPVSLGASAVEQVGGFVSDTLDRYSTIREDFATEIDDTVTESFFAGDRWETLADKLVERHGVARSYAEGVARDEVGRLSGRLNEARQTDIGITHYTWGAVLDGRERPEHGERDGEVFAWDSPPDDGHPGEAYNCRCFADPVLPGDLEREAA